MEKYDNVKRMINLDSKLIEDQAIEKAKMATVQFSKEYKLFFIIFENNANRFLRIKIISPEESPKVTKSPTAPKNVNAANDGNFNIKPIQLEAPKTATKSKNLKKK